MHVTHDLSHKVCVIRELFVFGRENFVFLKFWQVIIFDILCSRSCDSQWPLRCYCQHQIHSLSMQKVWNSKKVKNGTQGTVVSKTAKPVHLVEKGLTKLRTNLAEVNPTHKIEPEVCLTLQVESQHGVSHFKHPSYTVLEYTEDLGNTMRESP